MPGNKRRSTIKIAASDHAEPHGGKEKVSQYKRQRRRRNSFLRCLFLFLTALVRADLFDIGMESVLQWLMRLAKNIKKGDIDESGVESKDDH